MVRRHVGEEPDAERYRAEEMTEDFHDEHEPGEPPEWTEELLHVLETMLARSGHVVGDEGHEAETEGDVEVRGRRGETGDEPDQVADQDEDEKASEKRDVACVAVADHAFGKAADRLDEDRGDVAARDAI